MKCKVCGNDMEGEWEYCPRCGARSRSMMPNFNDIFSRVEKQMREMKDIEKNFEIMDISPFFRNVPKGGKGFSIKITRTGNDKPKVEVRNFGSAQPGPLLEKGDSGPAEKTQPLMSREIGRAHV